MVSNKRDIDLIHQFLILFHERAGRGNSSPAFVEKLTTNDLDKANHDATIERVAVEIPANARVEPPAVFFSLKNDLDRQAFWRPTDRSRREKLMQQCSDILPPLGRKRPDDF